MMIIIIIAVVVSIITVITVHDVTTTEVCYSYGTRPQISSRIEVVVPQTSLGNWIVVYCISIYDENTETFL
jgi:hypothetical protein